MYKKAIDLLTNMDGNEKALLAVELAKQHPSIFVKLALGEGKREDKIDEKIVSILGHFKEGRRVEGIRGVMSYFQYGPKEAYDVEKALRGEDVFLSSSQKLAVEKISNANQMLKLVKLSY